VTGKEEEETMIGSYCEW